MEPLEPFITGVPEETLISSFEPTFFTEELDVGKVAENQSPPIASSKETEFSLDDRNTRYWLTSATLRIFGFNGDGSARYTAKLKLMLNGGEVAAINAILETGSVGIPDAEYSENITFPNPIYFDSKEKLSGIVSIDADGSDYGFCEGFISINGTKQTK